MAKHNRFQKLCLVAAAVLLLVMHMCVCASAGRVDYTRKCSITFTMAYNGEPISGGCLQMYRIAVWSLNDRAYAFEWVPELADAGLNLADANSEDFARHVFMLVDSRSLPAVKQIVGKDGTVTFDNLESGLYIVYQTEPAPGFEPINAFCVSLPIAIGDNYVYDVMASPKPRPAKPDPTSPTTPESSTEPESSTTPEQTTIPETPTDPDTSKTPGETTTSVTNVYEQETPPIISMEDKLPQTGQLWWPAWMLSGFGAILLGLGVLLRFLLRQGAEESEI